MTRQRLVAMEQSRRGVQAKQCAVGNGGKSGFWLALKFVVQSDRGVGPTREARGGPLSSNPKGSAGKEIGAELPRRFP